MLLVVVVGAAALCRSFVRKEHDRFFKTAPIQALTAVVAKILVFPLHRLFAPRAEREPGRAGSVAITADLRDLQRPPIDKLPLRDRGDEQVIGRQTKAVAELFQRVDGGGGLAPGNGAQIARTEGTSFGGTFIAEVVGSAQIPDICRKIDQKHLTNTLSA